MIRQNSMDSCLRRNDGIHLPVKEIKGQRVITVKQVASLHKQAERNIRKNFTNNQNHFLEGVDYFRGKGVKFTPTPDTLYFTESGYLMLTKSLKDALSWQIMRELVNTYFRVQLLEQVLSFLPARTQQAIYYRGLGLTQKETGKLLGINKDTVQSIERDLRPLGYTAPNLGGKRSGTWHK